MKGVSEVSNWRKVGTYADDGNDAIASSFCGIEDSYTLILLELFCAGRHDYRIVSNPLGLPNGTKWQIEMGFLEKKDLPGIELQI